MQLSSAIVLHPLHIANRPNRKQCLEQRCSHSLSHLLIYTRSGFAVELFELCTPNDLFEVCVWVLEAGVSFCWVFLLDCSVRLGCIWDIDEKGWGENVAFPI